LKPTASTLPEQRHDLWVVGDEPCVLLDWSKSDNYAEPAG